MHGAKLEFKAWYTISELAEMAGLSKHVMKRKLEEFDLPGVGDVLLVELQDKAPALWKSLVESERLRRMFVDF